MEELERKEIITQINKITMEVTTNYGHREITVDEVDPPMIGMNCVREYKDHLKNGVMVGQELDTRFTNIVFDTKQFKISELTDAEPQDNEQMLLKLNYLCRLLSPFRSFDITIGGCAFIHTTEEPYVYDGVLNLDNDEGSCGVRLKDIIDFNIEEQKHGSLIVVLMSKSLGKVKIEATEWLGDILFDLGYRED